jgi:hypothetical protein
VHCYRPIKCLRIAQCLPHSTKIDPQKAPEKHKTIKVLCALISCMKYAFAANGIKVETIGWAKISSPKIIPIRALFHKRNGNFLHRSRIRLVWEHLTHFHSDTRWSNSDRNSRAEKNRKINTLAVDWFGYFGWEEKEKFDFSLFIVEIEIISNDSPINRMRFCLIVINFARLATQILGAITKHSLLLFPLFSIISLDIIRRARLLVFMAIRLYCSCFTFLH